MAYNDYGYAFKMIRKQRGISLSDIEYVSGVPKSTISQFENGHSLISFDKLEEILETMSLTIWDYVLVISKGEPEYFIMQFQEIEDAFIEQSEKKLKNIYEINIKNHEKQTNFLAYCAKSSFNTLHTREVEELEKYFISKGYWSLFDLYALFYTLEQISIELLLYLLNDLFFVQTINYKYLKNLLTYRKPLVWILVRSSLVLIENKYFTFVEKLIKEMENFFGESDLTAKIGIEYIKGCLYFSTQSKHKGRAMVSNTLSMLTAIDAIKIKQILYSRFRKIELMLV